MTTKTEDIQNQDNADGSALLRPSCSEIQYKVWNAHYDWSGGWGAFEEIKCVVVAETMESALGWVLMGYPETSACFWILTEIQIETPGVTHMSSRQS
jgi:hypothetical protein